MDKLAKKIKKDRSFVINESIETYLDIHKWQIGHIKKAVKQVDHGEFASDKELAKALKKWHISRK